MKTSPSLCLQLAAFTLLTVFGSQGFSAGKQKELVDLAGGDVVEISGENSSQIVTCMDRPTEDQKRRNQVRRILVLTTGQTESINDKLVRCSEKVQETVFAVNYACKFKKEGDWLETKERHENVVISADELDFTGLAAKRGFIAPDARGMARFTKACNAEGKSLAYVNYVRILSERKMVEVKEVVNE